MKKITVLAFALALITVACKPKKVNDPTPVTPADTTPPVIQLIGEQIDTTSLNMPYTDFGAVATDNVDGVITTGIVVTGVINVNLVGNYVKKFNVKDAAGNSAVEVQRLVNVRNDAAYLAGVYTAVPNCGSTMSSNYNTSISVSSTINNQITFSNLINNSTGSNPTGLVTANSIMLDPLSNGSNTYGGNGTIASTKKTITMSTTASNGSGYFNCTSVLTKQ